MAVFQSKYRELSFYVNGAEYKFASGTFATDDSEAIAVLEQITDAQRVDTADTPKKQPEEPQKDVEPAGEAAKPAPKPRKASASSAK